MGGRVRIVLRAGWGLGTGVRSETYMQQRHAHRRALPRIACGTPAPARPPSPLPRAPPTTPTGNQHLTSAVAYYAIPHTLLVLCCPQGAADNPWLALYVCVIATCRTLAEWRAMLAALAAPRLTVMQRLYGLGLAHLVGRGGRLAARLWAMVGAYSPVSR